MPRAGGIYTLPPGYLAVSGETIQPSNHNPPLQDIAQALTESLPRDGTAGMTGNLPMGAHKITGLAAATNAGDVPRLDQVVRRDGNGAMTGNLAMGNNKITGLAAPTASSDAARKADVDAMLPLTGGNVSGPIRVPGGSESAPSLQFSNENNGIYWLPGTGPFFTAGGSIIARLTSGTSLSAVDSIVTRQAGDNRYMQQNWTLTAGTGLSGGGTGAANRTLTIALGQLAYSTANMTEPRVVVVDGTSSGTQARMGDAAFRSNFNLAGSATSITAGAGLTGGGDLSASRNMAMGTPSSITRTSTNSASGNTHTHNLPQADFRDMMANYLDAGAIGSPGFMYCSGAVPVSPGTTRPGSTLYFTNAANDETTNGPQATGTWMCLGYLSAAGHTHARKTHWRRIS